jgi:hypothetical protein
VCFFLPCRFQFGYSAATIDSLRLAYRMSVGGGQPAPPTPAQEAEWLRGRLDAATGEIRFNARSVIRPPQQFAPPDADTARPCVDSLTHTEHGLKSPDFSDF